MHATAAIHPIKSGVPQGSVLCYICMYVLLTPLIFLHQQKQPLRLLQTIVLLSLHEDPHETSTTLQRNFNIMEKWFHKWCFRVNENKSSHVTLMLRR